MARPSQPPRRHHRRNSSQRRIPPMTPDAQATPRRRRNLYCPPMSVTSRQIQIRNWRDELHDLTENLAQIQERIQQLETVHPEDSSENNDDDSRLGQYPIIPPRSSSIPYRLPELGFDPAKDDFQLQIDDWLKASPPDVPTSDDASKAAAPDNVAQKSTPSARRSSLTLGGTPMLLRKSHYREQSAATTSSFDSYSTEAVQVYEASTAAMTRPCVRSIASIRAAQSAMPAPNTPWEKLPRQPSFINKENRPPTPGLFPAPLFSGGKPRRRPRKTSSLSRPSSDPVSRQDSRASQNVLSSPPVTPAFDNRCLVRQRPTSGATVIRHRRALTPSSGISSMRISEQDVSVGTPCFTTSELASPRSNDSEAYTRHQASTPISFQPPPWLHSSPPPSDVPQLDSTTMSISEPATPTPARANGSPRLMLFPKIQQTSSESLIHEARPKHAHDPFYSVPQDQSGFVEPTSTPAQNGDEGVEIVNPYIYLDCPDQDTAFTPIARPKRDADASRGLVKSPRRKLRSFLRKITPTANKARYSLPSRSTKESSALATINNNAVTPPRLPTRRGSTMPFDQALLGELTKISDRRASPQKAAPTPARRIRSSMHDAAGLSLGRTAAATHAHWRAQRSRTSILSPMPPRSRAPTGSTFNTSFSSGPSFHFLPKVDQIGTPSDRRGSAMRRQRRSRY